MTQRASFYHPFLKLAVPVALQNLLVAIVGVSDAVMLKTFQSVAFSSVSLANQVAIIFTSLITGLSIGTSALAAQYWGKNDASAVKRVMFLTMQFSMVIGVLFFLSTFFFNGVIMTLLTNEEELIRNGSGYLRMTSFSYLFMSFSQIYMIIMKNTNQARRSSAIGGFTAALNILLNYLLIFGHLGLPALGAVGAGLATSLSRLMEFVIVFLVSQEKRKEIHFEPSGLLGHYKALRKKFLHYSIPVVIKSGLWILASSVLLSVVGHMGTAVVTAHSVVIILFNLAAAIIDGLAAATGIHLGQLLGDHQMDRAKADAKKCILVSVTAGSVMALAMILLRPVILGLNRDLSAEAVALLPFMLVVIAVKTLAKSFNTVTTRGMLCTGGDVRYINILDAVNMWCVVVPAAMLAAYILHLPIWIVYILVNMDELTKMPLQIRRVFQYRWVKDLTVKEWAEPGRYENMLREHILKSIPAGVLLIGSYGRISYINSEAERILNISTEEMRDRSLMHVFVQHGANDEFTNLLLDALYNQKQLNKKKLVYHRDGQDLNIELSTMMIEEEDLKIGICATMWEVD